MTTDGVQETMRRPLPVSKGWLLGRDLASVGLRLRAGIHTGEVEVRGDDIGGIAARIAALAGADEVLTSRTLRDLTAGAGLVFEDRGAHAFKGAPDEWQVYAVTC